MLNRKGSLSYTLDKYCVLEVHDIYEESWGSPHNYGSTREIKGKVEIESKPDQGDTLRKEKDLTENSPDLRLTRRDVVVCQSDQPSRLWSLFFKFQRVLAADNLWPGPSPLSLAKSSSFD